MNEKNPPESSSFWQQHLRQTVRYLRTFALWTAAGLALGLLGGLVGTLFCYAIRDATAQREAMPWLLYLLPFGGLLIVWVYRMRGMHPTDTNGILLAIHSPPLFPALPRR